MDKTIYLCLAHMSEEGIEQKYVKEAFDTNWVVPLGPNVNAFEEDLKRFVGEGKEVVALSAGTAAVHLALLACGVGQGDEVIVQSFTFCASSHPVTYLGLFRYLWILRKKLGTCLRNCWKKPSKTALPRLAKSQKLLFLWHCMACPMTVHVSWR